MAGLGFVLRNKIWPPAEITGSFADKTVIVTGSNTGIGLEAAVKFVTLGAAKVILAVRSLEKGEHAKEDIEKRTGKKNVLQVWQLDMNDYQSIDAFTQRVDRELEKLDIAVLNAGVVQKNFVESSNGWEMMLQINCISTALLAILLLPKLKASWSESSTPVMEIVSSIGHINANIKATDEKTQLLHQYNNPTGFGTMSQYSLSKLFIMWVLRELAKRCTLPDGTSHVILNDTCPGPTRSDVTRSFDSFIERILRQTILWLMSKPTEQGARTVVGATLLGPESHGRWWVCDEYMT